MSFNDLRIFKEVYEQQSITKAAKKLYISQPAISRAIKQLETQYSTQLFERTGKRLLRTESANCLYTKVSTILETYDTISDALKNTAQNHTIRIGSNTTLAKYYLTNLITTFTKEHPTTTIQVTVANEETLLQALQHHELDLALIENNVHEDNLISIHICNSPLSMIASPQFHAPTSCTIEELSKYPLLIREKGSAQRNYLDAIFASHQLSIQPLWQSSNTEVLLEACKNGLGIAIVPSIYTRYTNFQQIHITNETLIRKCYLVYHKNKYIHPTLQQCITFIQEEMEDTNA